MSNQNGKHPPATNLRLRWIWFGGSITSERGNPLVPTHRLVMQELQERGHEIEYLEPATHPAFIDRLKEDGSDFYRSFLAAFPELRYRRYDMPRGAERDVWLSREAALVDVVIIESNAPPELFAWLSRLDNRTFVRILLSAGPEVDAADFDFVVGPEGAGIVYQIVNSGPEVRQQVERLLNAVSSAQMRLVTQE